MSAVELVDCGGGHFSLCGELSFHTVVGLLARGRDMFAGEQSIELDLSAVTHSDSAGLSLLIEWLKQAKLQGKSLRYISLPPQLRALADVSEVRQLLSPLA